MTITIKEVKTKRDLKAFVRFPFRLYKSDPKWIPPLLRDEFAYFNRERNKKLKNNPHILFLAFKDNRISGRIVGVINKKANALKNQKYVRWTFLDTENDKETAHSLLDSVEKWGKNQGMVKAVGPRGFSDLEPQGAMVEGFKEQSTLNTHYNKPYLIDFITSYGYEKDVDWVSYKIKIPDTLPDVYQSILDETAKKHHLTHISFKKKSEMKPYIIPVFRLFNETYKDLYSFAPMTEADMKSLAKKYLPILDPYFVQIVKDKDRLVAFAIVMPDLSAGFIKARGRLFPFGLFHILRAKNNSKVLQLLLIGIQKDYRGQGIFTLFAEHLKKITHKKGMKWIDSHQELEDNWAIRKWMERLNGKINKRYRAYIKAL